MNRKIILSSYLVLFIFLSIPQQVFAVDKKLGEECSNFTCASGDCEEAEDDKKYCTCDEAKDCSDEYSTQGGETWKCDGGTDRNNLHYCESNLPGRTVHYGTGKESGANTPGVWNNLKMTDDEIQRLTSKPETKITIPGLKFSDARVIEDAGEGAFLDVPFLGEYLAAVYRYGIAAAGIMSIVIIINAALNWVQSAGNAQVITKQKETIEKAVIGLILSVSSFSILYFINPNLTKFNNLKVQYIKAIALDSMTFDKTSDTDYGGNVPEALSTPELEKLFAAYASCFNLDPGILKGIARAESGLNTQAGAGKKYQGLFQMDDAYCAGGLKVGKYPDSLNLNDCKNRINPEINTASAAATISHNIENIKRSCPDISVDDAMQLLYVAHNNGPGVMNFIIGRKSCTEEQMRLSVRAFYDNQQGGALHGVDANYGERKFLYGKKVVNAVHSYNVTSLTGNNDSSLCPTKTGQRILAGGNTAAAPTGGPVVCGENWRGHKVLALGDSNTEYDKSYMDVLKRNCPHVQFIKEAHFGKNAEFLYDLIKNRDLRAEGFTDIMVWAGVNNIGNAQVNLKKIYQKAGNSGLRVIGISVTPWKAYGSWSAANQTKTDQVDSWIRGGGDGSINVIIDVYSKFEDPNEPDALAPRYRRDHPTNEVHLSPLGQEELAQVVAQQAFR